jgi:hypothetical protein
MCIMSRPNDWWSDEALERTMALGDEMAKFLPHRRQVKAKDPGAKIEPHPELLALIAAIKVEEAARYRPGKD